VPVRQNNVRVFKKFKKNLFPGLLSVSGANHFDVPFQNSTLIPTGRPIKVKKYSVMWLYLSLDAEELFEEKCFIYKEQTHTQKKSLFSFRLLFSMETS
jgi:hypothetical protein